MFQQDQGLLTQLTTQDRVHINLQNPATALSHAQRKEIKIKKSLNDFFSGIKLIYRPIGYIPEERLKEPLVLVRLNPVAKSLVSRCA